MCKILLILIYVFSINFNVEALSVVPFVHSFDPKNNNEKTFQYYIENKTNDFLAFEIKVFRRKLDKKGNDILEKDEKSFMLRPSQVIIPPHTYRNVKVKWRGNEEFKKNPEKEQAFRVVMSQFPINLNKKKEKNQSSIQVLYEIKASLYATPKSAQPDLKLVSENANVIVLRNDGNKRAELKKSNLVIHDKKITDLIKPDDVSTVVLARSTREYKKK